MNVEADALSVTSITAETARPLRAKILRPGLPVEASYYPGDTREGSVHFGVFQNGVLIGCASVFAEDHPDLPGHSHWRLRGMAVEEDYRGAGIGSCLLNACKAYAASQEAPLVWCYARTRAIPFYIKQGFEVVGDGFDIDGLGEHFLSTYALT